MCGSVIVVVHNKGDYDTPYNYIGTVYHSRLY